MVITLDTILPVSEKRVCADRRGQGVSRIRYLLLGGRRSQIRREGDKHRFMLLDNYNTALFSAVLLILFLCLVDGFLTLYLIGDGAIELNPIMDYFININPWVFILAKYISTGVAAFCLIAFNQYKLRSLRCRTYVLLPGIIVVYTCVITWEITLLMQ